MLFRRPYRAASFGPISESHPCALQGHLVQPPTPTTRTWTSAQVARICGLRDHTHADRVALQLGYPETGKGARRHWTLDMVAVAYIVHHLSDGPGERAAYHQYLNIAFQAADAITNGARPHYLTIANDHIHLTDNPTDAIAAGINSAPVIRIVRLERLLEAIT